MIRYIGRRLFWGVITICMIVSVNFMVLKLVPGDPISGIIGEYPAPPEYVAQVREEFGLDQSIAVQFRNYALKMIKGDFGFSFANRQPVLPLIITRAQYTLLLIVPALVISALLGIALAILTAAGARPAVDTSVSAVVVFGYSMPTFWLGQMLILVFAVHLAWLPAAGMQMVRTPRTGLAGVLDISRHMIMPLVCIVCFKLAVILRVARSSITAVLRSDFVTTARAKGLSEFSVMWRHVLPNALVPIIIVVGYQLGHALTSSILVETVFAWPGLGSLFVQSVTSRDFPVLQGILVLSTILVVAGNLFADILAALADPRVRRNLGSRDE